MVRRATPTLAHARPVVIEESATLTRPDVAWTFGRSGVAIDGDFALVLGERITYMDTADIDDFLAYQP